MEAIGNKLENPVRAYAFDQLLILPGLGKIEPSEIDISVKIGGLRLKAPLISAPMDTVTGSRLAIALALRGGLGVIHRNCSIEQTVKMIRMVKSEKVPDSNALAPRDRQGRLAVGAGLSPMDIKRATALYGEADLLFIDVASFHNRKLVEGAKRIIGATGAKIVVGNFGTADGVRYAIEELGEENVSAVKVGMGGGSICTTTDVSGVGSPSTFAIEQAALALKQMNLLQRIPIIGDGGISKPRDVAIAIGLGASAVMLGKVFAACEESCAKTVWRSGEKYKVYWGMGSAQARKKRMALDRYQDYQKGKQIDEGVKMYLRVSGSVENAVGAIEGSLRVGMGYVGAGNLQEMHQKSMVVARA
ncbi:MAG: guanosine monophosphate reductase [Candidatus Micrarchaeota archaeon]|nr:guanosine monophosphate reductase [Candidatus Micrarchaeota archaeon]